MELEISPEPSCEERAAIALALSSQLADGSDAPSPWWEAGVQDATDDDGADRPQGA